MQNPLAIDKQHRELLRSDALRHNSEDSTSPRLTSLKCSLNDMRISMRNESTATLFFEEESVYNGISKNLTPSLFRSLSLALLSLASLLWVSQISSLGVEHGVYREDVLKNDDSHGSPKDLISQNAMKAIAETK